MSFMLTTDQILHRTKTVTRRTGWSFLKPGDLIQACEKCQGLKKGEKIKRLAVIRIKSVRFESLYKITKEDVKKEGFYGWHPDNFILLYLKHNGGNSGQLVTRIEFEYI